MKAKIDKRFVATLKPGEKPFEVSDVELPGFVLRVWKSGAMLYGIRYQVKRTGPWKRMTIGDARVISAQDAREAAREALSKATSGIDPAAEPEPAEQPAAMTFKEFLDTKFYPTHLTTLRTGEAAKKRIETAFEDFLQLPLEEINAWRIDRWKAGYKGQPATRNRYIDDLRSALRKAAEWGDITQVPKFKRERLDKSSKVRYLQPDEEKRLHAALDEREEKRRAERDSANRWRSDRGQTLLPDLRAVAFTDHLKPLVLLSLNTGARRGELFSLRWCDVDFDGEQLTIEGKTAKTGQTRHIPLNSAALDVLKKWHARRPSNDLVFPGEKGAQLDNTKTAWEGLLTLAKIKNFRWHDMRHDFASKLVMAGVDLNTVRDLLGHTDIKMTLRYSHLSPTVKRKAVEVLVVPEGKVIPFTKGKRKA